jgi:hypothetical protein
LKFLWRHGESPIGGEAGRYAGSYRKSMCTGPFLPVAWRADTPCASLGIEPPTYGRLVARQHRLNLLLILTLLSAPLPT